MKNDQMPQFPKSFWRDSVSLPEFSKLEDSIEADVGIVGGGITGITAAYLLAKQNIKVVLLDAGVILNGTTGHTTAKTSAQHGLIYDELIQHFGLENAKLYYQAQTEGLELVEKIITEENIKCDYKKADAYLYTNNETYVTQLETEKEAYDQINIPSDITDQMPLNIPHKKALIMKDQAEFHPLKYLNALVNESIKNGAFFYENTAAVDVEYSKHPTIVTRDGKRVKCGHIISASNFPFYDGLGFYPTRMYADRSYTIAIKTDEKYPGGMYINAETPTRSIRTTTINGEDLWLVGGENHKTGQGKSTIEYYEALQKFAELEFGIKEYVYRWSAQDLITLDKLPYIGKVTKTQSLVYVATGYRKWGMTNGTIAAKIISDLIIKKESPYEQLFSPSRFQADPALRKFASVNADVAKHLIKGKLEYTKNNIDELATDNATITRINGKRTGVYKDINDKLHMVDTTCTHLGCEVAWNSGERTWDCPCHGSRFSHDGEVINGPAKRSLTKIEMNH